MDVLYANVVFSAIISSDVLEEKAGDAVPGCDARAFVILQELTLKHREHDSHAHGMHMYIFSYVRSIIFLRKTLPGKLSTIIALSI